MIDLAVLRKQILIADQHLIMYVVLHLMKGAPRPLFIDILLIVMRGSTFARERFNFRAGNILRVEPTLNHSPKKHVRGIQVNLRVQVDLSIIKKIQHSGRNALVCHNAMGHSLLQKSK